ncbi:serine hydrolase domain-containing protein [Alkaliphilus hydrothermalis]|uniref:CubicO group peptidase (Beta-lactamase class C family) n=1 Tax=Alkaliphilus hydrothermalis TaxID=1482730 RepID=A0ABS2NTS1_9FIRM|nr:serine hydrolase domain-containing protein [Alkaliphilus hydrothermalis]MBM7616345.1 CubicO group peptidase (beta-lactamase class C family) [Alkaliphilus hydrothermalis]
MKRCKLGKKKILKAISIVVVVIAVGFGGYCVNGLHKINELSRMTFEEMLAYTTKDNKDAVITVGIIQNGKMTYDVYGENGNKLPTKEHTYEIGSITKTFTTSLLCKAIKEGRISLDDSIDVYLNLPKKDYYPTIRRLMTHTSGYKEYYFEKPMILNFLRGKNDYNGISEEMLIERLGKINLDNTGYSFKYSNFGMATLGSVLERIYDEDYTKLINDYISEDLGLTNTKISDNSGDLKNYWEWSESDAYMPAGALLSNIRDMMKYVQIQMNNKSGNLSIVHEALVEVNASSRSYEKMGIRIDIVGAGWMIDNENKIIWHNGGTGNYNSYIGFDKENQIGVVILSNLPPNYKIPATIMGIEILTSLQK